MTETPRLRQLQDRISELEAELARTHQPGAPQPPAAKRGGRWRSITAGTLIVLACVLAPLSVTAVWADDQVSNTDAYVDTVAPLADDPAIQSAVAAAVTDEILTRVNVPQITGDAITALQAQDLPPRVTTSLAALQVPITNAIEGFIGDKVADVIASPGFAAVWEQANRAAHAQLVNLMSGETTGAVAAENGEVTLDLGPIIADVKEKLVAQGYTIAQRVPEVDRSLVLVRSDAVTKTQGVYRLLDRLGTWLPIIALGLLGLGVYVAKGHRRALMLGALGVAVGMLVMGVALAVGRLLYLDSVPSDVLPREAAANVFDTLVRFLRTGLRATAVLALLVALGAFLSGSSVTALRTRAGVLRGLGSLRRGAQARGLDTGRAGTWTYAHKRALRIGLLVAGLLTLTFWSRPTVAVVLGTAIVVLVLLALVELLGRPPGEAPVVTEPRETGPDETRIVEQRAPDEVGTASTADGAPGTERADRPS